MRLYLNTYVSYLQEYPLNIYLSNSSEDIVPLTSFKPCQSNNEEVTVGFKI